MPRKRFTAEQIVNNLREAEVLIAQGLKELERENIRLKRLVADLSLDKSMLQEVARENF